MAWNEPGNNGKDQDPWGNRGSGGSNQGPPDLDEALGKLVDRINGLFGGNSGKRSGGGQEPAAPAPSGKLILVILAVVAVVWAGMGFYTVDQQERAVVLRLGKYLETVQPGLQWNPRLVDDVTKVNVTAVRNHDHVSLMLTKDENIVEVGLSVQYVVSNPKDFLLEVRSPENSLAQATESALRHVVGSSKMDDVLTEGRAILADQVQARLQTYLDSYQTGLEVSKVNIENTSAPSQVQDAFDDVIKAREDEQRVKNEAQTYANGIVPEARGKAQRMMEEASAYREEVVAKAEGEATRFTKLLTEYQKAPEVTRERLYLVAMEDVLSNSAKVLVDVEGGNNMMVLPLDQIMNSAKRGTTNFGGNTASSADIDQITNQVIQELGTRTSTRISTRESR
ncbi:MAG: FtsH protease activity modulator HflK [Gammaproteobacteria bacterium]|jgi:membrane protease subunit HflK|nr:FtsH protease activity modulator HflK [Gammaproteobacteria bacterium]